MSFDNFWSVYPKKVNKKKAQRAWEKLKLTSLSAKIIDSLNKQKKQWKDPTYIPHASTWLNGERWEDIVEDHLNVDDEWNAILDHVRRRGSQTKVENISDRARKALSKMGGLSTIGLASTSMMPTLKADFKRAYLSV